MAFSPFPRDLFVKTIDTGEEIVIGEIQTGHALELKYLRAILYKHGTGAGTERCRINIYSDEGRTSLLYQSAWSSLSDIEDLSTMWLGWVRFDFAGESLNQNLSYFATIETDGYTRNADAFFISYVFDWPVPVYEALSGTPLAISVYGHREAA